MKYLLKFYIFPFFNDRLPYKCFKYFNRLTIKIFSSTNLKACFDVLSLCYISSGWSVQREECGKPYGWAWFKASIWTLGLLSSSRFQILFKILIIFFRPWIPNVIDYTYNLTWLFNDEALLWSSFFPKQVFPKISIIVFDRILNKFFLNQILYCNETFTRDYML